MVLRHKSALLQMLSTLTFSVPLVLALTSEHQVVSGTAVQLVSLPKGGLHSASLSLSDSRLQIYSASVDITFVLTGFRYYMFHWFLTSMAIGTIIISNLYVAAIGWLSKRFGSGLVARPLLCLCRCPLIPLLPSLPPVAALTKEGARVLIRIFGASFDVDEELGGARKGRGRDRASAGARSRRSSRYAKGLCAASCPE